MAAAMGMRWSSGFLWVPFLLSPTGTSTHYLSATGFVFFEGKVNNSSTTSVNHFATYAHKRIAYFLTESISAFRLAWGFHWYGGLVLCTVERGTSLDLITTYRGGVVCQWDGSVCLCPWAVGFLVRLIVSSFLALGLVYAYKTICALRYGDSDLQKYGAATIVFFVIYSMIMIGLIIGK